MKEFEGLTPRGRLRRLRALALDALREYDLDVKRCSFVSTGFNTVFRVDAANGSAYALRVSPSLRIHADDCELVEAAWVAALGRDTNVAVPQVIPAGNGSAVVWVEHAGVPEPRSCVLFEWVRGRPLRQRLTLHLVRKTGELTARVHAHGAAYASDPPAGALVADQVLYFRTESRLDELRHAYGSALDDAVERSQRALDQLWREPPQPPHLLHGDVQPSNVMVNRGQVVLIDFQDLIWGFEIQDVTIALVGLEHFDDRDALRDAFRSGYETVRPWPDADGEMVAALGAARHLNILNFGLSVRGPDLDRFVARHAAPVVQWMSS